MKTVLVVDPDPCISQWLGSVFAEEYEITAACSLQEAIELLSSLRFDLVITEAFSQNGIFGFDPAFLARLKQPAANTPIILFSTYATPNMRNGSSLGLAGILPKPTELSEIIEKVNGAIRRGGSSARPQPFEGLGPRAATASTDAGNG